MREVLFGDPEGTFHLAAYFVQRAALHPVKRLIETR